MITTRSLLFAVVTAGWTSWKAHCLKKRLFSRRSWAAFLREIFVRFSVGRYLKPFVRACLMSARARFSEPEWHTTSTRTPFGCLAFAAEESERSFGTLPPAAGWTRVSGFGFGQYEVRSTCASAELAIS